MSIERKGNGTWNQGELINIKSRDGHSLPEIPPIFVTQRKDTQPRTEELQVLKTMDKKVKQINEEGEEELSQNIVEPELFKHILRKKREQRIFGRANAIV